MKLNQVAYCISMYMMNVSVLKTGEVEDDALTQDKLEQAFLKNINYVA